MLTAVLILTGIGTPHCLLQVCIYVEHRSLGLNAMIDGLTGFAACC
jgi:hypothetical protein